VLGLIAAALGTMAALIADVATARTGASRPFSYGVGFLVGLAASLALSLSLAGQADLGVAGIAVIAYGAWWFILLNLVQALDSSLRVRLLGEVRAAGGRIDRAALEARYNDDVLLRRRLDRLREHGAIVERDGKLCVFSPGLRLLAEVFRRLKLALLGRASEFEGRTS
jgi:hypothetical protein